MKISPISYNPAGELMAPLDLDVKLAGVVPGGVPTLEAGFYHRFKFEARSAAEFAAKRRRFIDDLAAVPRSIILVVDEYDVTMDSYHRHGLDVIYAIESDVRPAAPTRAEAIAARLTASASIAPLR